MAPRTLWIMLALVLLLGGVAWWQLEREATGTFTDQPLFEGARPERMRSVRIDHLERGLQMRIERQADDSWQIVDPLTYPAEAGVIERLLEAVTRNRANVIGNPDLKALGLSPPRAVLELVEDTPAGERKLRLELGIQDLDRKHVYARIDGQVVRTLLNLDSTLERDLPDWRRRRILEVHPGSVLEIRRSGKLALEPGGALVDLALEAGTTETGWRASSPWNAALDPAMVEMLLNCVCYLQARTFLADSAVQVPAFGLENPDLRFELSTAAGTHEVLLLKRHVESKSWNCMREGSTHVFRVDEVDVVFLTMPSDGLLDLQLARVAREAIERVELLRDGERVRLWRDGPLWKVARLEGEAPKEELRADPEAVGDLLAQIEAARAVRFLLDGDPPAFTPAQAALGWRVFTKDQELGADFGTAHEAAPGVAGRLFQRPGEGVFGVVEDKFASLAARPVAELVERQMVRLPEAGIARIELSRGDLRRVFVRDANTGRWSSEGTSVEAPKAFLKALERLLSLRADVAVAPGEPFELVDPWQVVLVDGGGERTSYRVGNLAVDPAKQGFDDGGQRGLITSSGLLADLAQIP